MTRKNATRSGGETGPTINSSDEDLHFIGNGWLDDFGDRLYVDIRGKDAGVIVWQRRASSVTFSAANSWVSFGGKFELIDRGTNPPQQPELGRWLIRSTEPMEPRRIWTFEAQDNISGSQLTLGRMKRHAVLAPGSDDLNGRYGFTLDWAGDGTLSTVTDSLGRALVFGYRERLSDQTVLSRALATVGFRPNVSSDTVPIVELQADNALLERASIVGAAGYTRFRYVTVPVQGSLLTQIIVAGERTSSSPGRQAPPLAGEVVLEENTYGPAYPKSPNGYSDPGYSEWDGFVGLTSKYPGRHYEYQYSTTEPHTTQLDLHQPTGVACSGGSGCPSGTRCSVSDEQCYVADVMTHASGTLLPTSRASADVAFGEEMGNPNAFERNYGTGGTPHDSIDAAGVRTSHGLDSLGRVRCIVRNSNDDDGEAFADPTQPDTSGCAGPTATAQIIRVDYNGPCSDGFANCVIKRTPSVFGGEVVEEEDFDQNGLSVRTKTVAKTRDVDGNVIDQTQIHTRMYDGLGRIKESDGPLGDAAGIGVDRTTTTYHAFDPASPFNVGQVHQVTRFVDTNGSSLPLVTTYSEYDEFGVPHRVEAPNGDHVLYLAFPDRLLWAIHQVGADNQTVGTSQLRLNPDGSVRSTIDADGVCMTFEYTDTDPANPANRVYVGAPTAIWRGASGDDQCGELPINRGSGEVEIRRYVRAERDRLASITRQRDGIVELSYAGFTYDRDRRLVSAATLDSSEPFKFAFTDVLPTGVTAPSAPPEPRAGGPKRQSQPQSPGWRTQTTVDELARPTALYRSIDASNTQSFLFSYASPMSPRPTQLTRGRNGSAASTTTFIYDDFGRLVESVVPEAGAPGAPAPTRFEYDVASRLTKKRIGIGTPLVQTTVTTYDSLGRTLAVDNDVEHPINCIGRFKPVQDEEYHYDSCPAPDVPAGFACNHALGRLTIARAVVECAPNIIGLGNLLFTRGRWYDYDPGGRVARVAYATVVTGGDPDPQIQAPAIMEYTYSPAGRVQAYTSPLNAAFGTRYFFNGATIQNVGTSGSTFPNIANGLQYRAFGPLTQLTTLSVQPDGDSQRRLTLRNSYRPDNTLGSLNWSFTHEAGPAVEPMGILSQAFSYTPAGLISRRVDVADGLASRAYGYDALLRMTCEARGDLTTQPSTADCERFYEDVPWDRFPSKASKSSAFPSRRLAGVFTYGDGQSPESPQDVRLTSFVQSEDRSYVSPSVETSSYASGSSQVQGIARTVSELVIGHDALGRRSFEFDSRDPVRSRRDFSYLPNGQLGEVAVRAANGERTGVAIRYDERGRPLLLRADRVPIGQDSYELFWDDADRLIAANIVFTPPRFDGSATGTLTSARWHYHYVGSVLVAATRELVGTAEQAGVKRFWVVSDERGLVHRFVDNQGATFWQARWDASGWRTLVGQPMPEMWVPFGLPGQVVLGQTVVYATEPGDAVIAWGSEAFAADSTGTWTRPPIALNRWRAYDPHLGGFLQPDPSDSVGAPRPEAYAYARYRFGAAADPVGRRSENTLLIVDDDLMITESCEGEDLNKMVRATNLAYKTMAKCYGFECGRMQSQYRGYLGIILKQKKSCSRPNALIPGSYGAAVGANRATASLPMADCSITTDGRFVCDGQRGIGFSEPNRHFELNGNLDWNSYYPPASLDASDTCLARSIAHEAMHGARHFLIGPTRTKFGALLDIWRGEGNDVEERFVRKYTDACFGDCQFVP